MNEKIILRHCYNHKEVALESYNELFSFIETSKRLGSKYQLIAIKDDEHTYFSEPAAAKQPDLSIQDGALALSVVAPFNTQKLQELDWFKNCNVYVKAWQSG